MADMTDATAVRSSLRTAPVSTQRRPSAALSGRAPLRKCLSAARSGWAPLRKCLFAAPLGLSLFALGCTDLDSAPSDGTTVGPSCAPTKPRAFVISTLGFTRVDTMNGTAPGFDLDGVVSDGTDPASCLKKDFLGPDGAKGVDNQLASLIPDVEKILGNAVDGLIQGAINNGDLLILLEVDGAKSMQDASCADLTVKLGRGKPTLGTDGVIEAYQTFDVDGGGEVSHGTLGKIEDGVLTVGPFELAIPIAIFDVAFTIHVHDALFRLTVDAEDGILKGGFVGGGVVPQEILDGVKDGAGVDKYIPVLTLVLNNSTDLKPDAEGTCTQLSAALQITAVEAFLRE